MLAKIVLITFAIFFVFGKKIKKEVLKEYIFPIFLFLIKVFLITAVFVLLATSNMKDFSELLRDFISLFISFVMVLITYGSFFANKSDRKIIVNAFKIYFPILAVLIVAIVTMANDTNNLKMDYHKTKLQYELSIKSKNISNTYNEYESFMEKYIKQYETKKLSFNEFLKLSLNDSNEEVKEKENKNIQISYFSNLCINFMTMITVLISLWLMSELSAFSRYKLKKIPFLKKN